MLMGHTDGLSERSTSKERLLADSGSELDEDNCSDSLEQILYAASFEELAANHLKYDLIIWLSISLLLVLAWGVGIIMLLYLPVRRYMLQKDISSRKLYLTPTKIVYKVSRPSFIPFWGTTTIARNVPLSLVIDIIIEQGWLQSIYGIHTFRVESIARGKAAPVDELQVQGVSDPNMLRKVVHHLISHLINESRTFLAKVNQSSRSLSQKLLKVIPEASKDWKPSSFAMEGENMGRMTSITEGSAVLRSPSKSWKMTGSPHHTSMERRGALPNELLMNKLEEVSKSVKRIELLVEKSQDPEHS